MKRTELWWSMLTAQQRYIVWHFERNQNKYGCMGGGLPDDCSECVNCGMPMLGSGICTNCINEYTELIAKADNAVIEYNEYQNLTDPTTIMGHNTRYD